MGLGASILYLLSLLLIEGAAAYYSSYYYKRYQPRENRTKYLSWLLWTTFFVELLASYTFIGYYSNYKILAFIKDTPFESNYWLYNLYSIGSWGFLIYYFTSFLKSKLSSYILRGTSIAFLLFSLYLIFFKTGFFDPNPQFFVFGSTLLLIISIFVFYFELLKSDMLLQLKNYLPFYISVGILAFNVCLAPLEILAEYYNLAEENNLFVNLRITVMLVGNFFMYGTFIYAFATCCKKKSYY